MIFLTLLVHLLRWVIRYCSGEILNSEESITHIMRATEIGHVVEFEKKVKEQPICNCAGKENTTEPRCDSEEQTCKHPSGRPKEIHKHLL